MRLSGDTQASGERPHTFLEFNSCGNAVVGLDLGATKLFGTVANLGGEFLHERSIPWLEQKPTSCVEQVCDLIQGLLEAPRPPQQKNSRNRSRRTWSHSLSTRSSNLCIQSRLARPAITRYAFRAIWAASVIVENDVNIAVLGEFWFGSVKNASILVCIVVGPGIGAGIVIERKIYHGHHFSAGEIGYQPPDTSSLRKLYPGFGALESVASRLGIENRAK